MQVAGRPRHVNVMPLTTNGAAVSIREYKSIHELGLPLISSFIKTVTESMDGMDLAATYFLTSPSNSELLVFVDAIIRAHIPPKLRGFFTNPQATEEYVKITRDGIIG